MTKHWLLRTLGTNNLTKKFIINANSPTITVDYTYWNREEKQNDNQCFFWIGVFDLAGNQLGIIDQAQQAGLHFSMSKTISKSDGTNFNAGDIIELRFLVYQAEAEYYKIQIENVSVHI